MRRFGFWGSAILAMGLASARPAEAQDIAQKDGPVAVTAGQGTPSDAGGWKWTPSLRFWLSSVVDKRFNFNDVEQTKSILIPMGGATISAEPPGGRLGSVDFTALYGTSSGSPFTEVDVPSGTVFQGNVRVTRLDLEAYAHIPIDRDVQSSTFNIGFRYIDSLNRVAGLDDTGVPFLNKERDTYFLSEFGVSGATQGLFSEHHDSLFGAINLEVGYLNSRQNNTCCQMPTEISSARSGGVAGIDGYFGYEIQFKAIADKPARLTFRYRIQIISAGGFDFSQPTLVHGPEILLGVTF
jgi:hypothetical protein